MIRALARFWIALCGITNNSKRGFIRRDHNGANGIRFLGQLWMALHQINHALQRARALVLIQAKFEMHSHDRKIIA